MNRAPEVVKVSAMRERIIGQPILMDLHLTQGPQRMHDLLQDVRCEDSTSISSKLEIILDAYLSAYNAYMCARMEPQKPLNIIVLTDGERGKLAISACI